MNDFERIKRLFYTLISIFAVLGLSLFFLNLMNEIKQDNFFMAIEELETEPVESQKEVTQENPDASLAFSSFAEYLSQYNLSNIAYGNVVFESSKEAPNSSTVIGYEASKNSTTSSSDDSSGQPILLIVIIILAISTFISVLMIVFDKTKATVESTNTRVYRDLILKDETE